MITIIKLDPAGREKIRYTGELVSRSDHELVVQAAWTLPARDLGYTRFEPGDLFTEYYYTDRWFNVFAISDQPGVRKGWYCNITEPAQFFPDRVTQVDLYLDVWVDPSGAPLILDEDEFRAATNLTSDQRTMAQQALQALLTMITSRQAMFASL